MLEFYLLNAFKVAFQMRNLTHRWTQSGCSFPKIRVFLSIFKKNRRDLAPITNFPAPYKHLGIYSHVCEYWRHKFDLSSYVRLYDSN